MIASFHDFLIYHKVKEKKIAVGVSGGSDSLALVLALHQELSPLGYEIISLTVDHRLRPTSAQEADYVAKIMNQYGIEHHILVWEGTKPATGIEEAARDARYKLISDWCKQHQTSVLMTAHHQEDQAETFFMRLQRGSGLDGLCGMRESGILNEIRILRPLLQTSKAELKAYLQQKNIHWIEDETNNSDCFMRGRLRKFMPEFCHKTKINIPLICETMQRLQSSQSLLNKITDETIQKHFRLWQNAGYSCRYETWQTFHPEIKFRVLSLICKQIGKLNYIPRAKNIISLIDKLNHTDFKSATLGNCEIILYNKNIWFVPQTLELNKYSCEKWDNYIKEHTKLQRMKIPYKMRAALVLAN